MKRVDLERSIAQLARQAGVEWLFVGGTNHDKFRLNGQMIMIPRHREIGENLAKKILKDCRKAIGEVK